MQKENCIVIYNISQEIPELIEDINTLCNIKIEEKQQESTENILILHLTSMHLDRIVKEINDSYLGCTAILLTKFYEILNYKAEECNEIYPISSHIYQLIQENELFFIKEENMLCLYENDISGKNTLISKIGGKNALISKNSTYIAIFGERITIYTSKDFLLYFEIFDSSISSAEFTNDEKFLILNSTNLTKIFRMSDMECILESDLSKITYVKDLYFYLHYLNQKVDLDGNFIDQISNLESSEFNQNVIKEFFNANVAQIYSENDLFAILTADPVKKIIFKNHIKSHPNIFKVNFYFSKNVLYCTFTKKVKDKEIYFVECYSDSILIHQFNNEIVDCCVSDTFSAYFDSKNQLIILEKKNILKEVLKLQVSNKIAFSMNKDGVLSVYYDTEDLLRFYHSNKLLSTTQFYHCTALKWSQSGCFLAALSLKSMSNNTIQFFNCSGKPIFKFNMPKAVDFYWVNYPEPSLEVKERITNNYDELVKSLPYKKLKSVAEDGDLEVQIVEWKEYLERKREKVNLIMGINN